MAMAVDGSVPTQPEPEPRSHTRRQRSGPLRIVVLLLLAVLGFGLSLAIRTNTATAGLATARPADLVRILNGLDADGERLRGEIEHLQGTRQQLAGTPGTQAALDDARSQADGLAILVGTVAVQGPGVALTVTDPRGTVGSEVLVDALQELRDAGAEAMELSGVRVVAATSVVDRADGGMTVDGSAVLPPYRLLAIGDAHTLAAAMRIPGGVVDTVASRAGAQAGLTELERIEVRALRQLPPPRYARPAG